MTGGNIKNYLCRFFSGELSKKEKILLSISFGWILLIGYLTWWNGIKSLALDKGFKWDEWIWFGVVPAITPYIFYFIWKKKE
jgi:hypothetical protein